MFNFSHNNYIEYGWGEQLYGYRRNTKDKFWFKFNKCTQHPLDFRSECIRAVKLIYESTEKKILIHFSGGIDSEIICRAFIEANLPFEVCIWRYNHKINQHDIEYAIRFCKEYDIKYTFFDMDILSFIQIDVFDIFKQKFFCHCWWSNVAKYVMSQMDGYQILGDGHLNLNHDPLGLNGFNKPSYIPPVLIPTKYYKSPPVLEAKTYKIVAESQHPEILSYLEQVGKEGCTGFFFYTPELLMSYIKDSFIQDWLKYCSLDKIEDNKQYPIICPDTKKHIFVKGKDFIKNLNTNCTLDIRQHIEYKHWPELKHRPKYVGIDSIRSIRMAQSEEFGESYPHNSPGNEIVAILADKFIRDLEVEDV